MKDYKCDCGEKRTYRRQYKCGKCWDKLTPAAKAAMLDKRMTKNKGTGALSLRGVV